MPPLSQTPARAHAPTRPAPARHLPALKIPHLGDFHVPPRVVVISAPAVPVGAVTAAGRRRPAEADRADHQPPWSSSPD
ncbi:hypothetical protein ACIHEJ_10070 [Streptomyces sp. NPDC052301]|uniref:hypothetical protein n=1 Tax=Streptomyces sp. NPDC052301 TaxID=3365687 RepID=UPI0037D979CA